MTRPLIFGVPLYRRYDLLKNLIASVMAGTRKPDRIVFVDNGCQFNEQDYAYLADRLVVLRPGRNLGVAAAWNQIVATCSESEDIVISNDDIEVRENGLQIMQEALAEERMVLGHGYSLFAMRKSLAARVGPFDDGFWPAYYEDNDFAHRVKLLGLETREVDAAQKHHGSATIRSFGRPERIGADKLFEKNKARYKKKWGGEPGREQYAEAHHVEPTK